MEKEIFKEHFLRAMAQSFADYREHGARSSAKLRAPHGCIARFVKESLGAGYAVKSFGIGDGKEEVVAGKYYDKRVDIAVSKGSRMLAAVSFKFVTSNYKQNSVNYFENLLGETANIRRADCAYAHILVLRKSMPYLARSSRVERVEKINAHNLNKYVRLVTDRDFPHKPDLLCVALLDGVEGSQPRFCEGDSDLGLDDSTLGALRGELSIDNFSEKFPLLCCLNA